jgi:hypothetical protein
MTQPCPTPVVVPARPAEIRLGERVIPVPSQPLCRESRRRRDVEFQADDPEILTLAPTCRSRWAGLAMAGFAAALLAVAAAALGILGVLGIPGGGWWGWAFLVLSLPLLLLTALVVRNLIRGSGRPRYRFDRRTGQLVIDRDRGPWKGYQPDTAYPLSAVLAVQLLYSGYHHISHSSAEGPTINEHFYTYEMDLLLDDARVPRLHLTTHGDWQWLRQEGRSLADFLGVPLVDQLYHGD